MNIEKTELTPDLFKLKVSGMLETIAIFTDWLERAEIFSGIMNTAREFGIENEVYDVAQAIAGSFNVPEFWETPKPFVKDTQLAPFPVSCLPELLSEYLKSVSEYVQVYPEMAALPLLSVLSLCVQRKAVIKHPGNSHTEPLNLYTLTVASPGERKTSCFKEFMRPVREYQDNYNTSHKHELNEYLIKKKFYEKQKELYTNGKNANLEKAKEFALQLCDLKPVRELKLTVTDATPEALAWEMSLQDNKIGVLGDEGGIFDILSGLYSGGTSNMNIFLEAYDGSDYTIIRRTKENIDLKNPLLTMGLMVQPDVYMSAMENQVFAGRGFIHRFLFSFPESKVGYQDFYSENIPEKLKYEYGRLVNRLLDMPDSENPPVICADKEAVEIFTDYHDHLQESMRPDGVFEDLKEWTSKQFGRALRIAGILHLCEHEPTEPLNGKTALNAVGISIWCENHALKALSTEMIRSQTDKNALYVLSRIRSENKQVLSKREILRLCRKLNAAEMEEPLEILEDMNYIRKEIVQGNCGRPNEKYKVNPLTFELY